MNGRTLRDQEACLMPACHTASSRRIAALLVAVLLVLVAGAGCVQDTGPTPVNATQTGTPAVSADGQAANNSEDQSTESLDDVFSLKIGLAVGRPYARASVEAKLARLGEVSLLTERPLVTVETMDSNGILIDRVVAYESRLLPAWRGLPGEYEAWPETGMPGVHFVRAQAWNSTGVIAEDTVRMPIEGGMPRLDFLCSSSRLDDPTFGCPGEEIYIPRGTTAVRARGSHNAPDGFYDGRFEVRLEDGTLVGTSDFRIEVNDIPPDWLDQNWSLQWFPAKPGATSVRYAAQTDMNTSLVEEPPWRESPAPRVPLPPVYGYRLFIGPGGARFHDRELSTRTVVSSNVTFLAEIDGGLPWDEEEPWTWRSEWEVHDGAGDLVARGPGVMDSRFGTEHFEGTPDVTVFELPVNHTGLQAGIYRARVALYNDTALVDEAERSFIWGSYGGNYGGGRVDCPSIPENTSQGNPSASQPCTFEIPVPWGVGAWGFSVFNPEEWPLGRTKMELRDPEGKLAMVLYSQDGIPSFVIRTGSSTTGANWTVTLEPAPGPQGYHGRWSAGFGGWRPGPYVPTPDP